MSTNIYAEITHVSWAEPASRRYGRLRRMIEGARAWHHQRKALAELSALDNRMLRDIGIDRSEINSIVNDKTGERRVRSQHFENTRWF
ncbi:MAG: DUF1127 domain-containing protein [Hyphomicrobiaceae bacterium]